MLRRERQTQSPRLELRYPLSRVERVLLISQSAQADFLIPAADFSPSVQEADFLISEADFSPSNFQPMLRKM